MYNKKYWNETVQLVFSYTYITFWLVQCFLFYTTSEMVPQQQIAWQGLDFFLLQRTLLERLYVALRLYVRVSLCYTFRSGITEL